VNLLRGGEATASGCRFKFPGISSHEGTDHLCITFALRGSSCRLLQAPEWTLPRMHRESLPPGLTYASGLAITAPVRRLLRGFEQEGLIESARN
jgi:hypothetical protein